MEEDEEGLERYGREDEEGLEEEKMRKAQKDR